MVLKTEASKLAIFCIVGPRLPQFSYLLSRQLFKCQEMLCSPKTLSRNYFSSEYLLTPVQGDLAQNTPHCTSQAKATIEVALLVPQC